MKQILVIIILSAAAAAALVYGAMKTAESIATPHNQQITNALSDIR